MILPPEFDSPSETRSKEAPTSKGSEHPMVLITDYLFTSDHHIQRLSQFSVDYIGRY